MIQYLFTYPANFGKLNIYKCDYFGNSLSLVRPCFVDDFSVAIEQKNVSDELLFGSFNQTPNFSLKNRKINIKTSFLFFFDESGNIGPAIDLLMNLSAWSYQGTQTSYKITGVTSINYTSYWNVQITYNQTQLVNTLDANYSLDNFQWYVVSDTFSYPLNFVSINTTTSIMNFTCVNQPTGTFWIEGFYYNDFALYQEPQFRMDSFEGSFYPCMIDKLTFNLTDEFAKIDCDIVAINYDKSTKYSFINAGSVVANTLPVIRLFPNFLIQLKDYTNDISNNFLITDLQNLDYMSSLITQRFLYAPVKKLTINIENNLQPIYNNRYTNLKRTYVTGYYSKLKKIYGDMSVYSLRSAQPTFDRYPTLSGVQNNNSISIYFGNQILTIPYTVWSSGNLEQKQNEDFVTMNFNWNAITNTRQGQPLFEVST